MRLIAWNPVLGPGGDACTLDVTPNDSGIVRGTVELMRALLAKVGIDAEPRDWEVRAFCSPYYTLAGARGDERFDQAWRVTVRFAGPCGECRLPPPFQPIGIDESDSTWRLDEASWECDGHPVVVLADWEGGVPRGILDEDPRLGGVTEVERVDFGAVLQTRLELGGLSWPRDEARIAPVLQACEEHGASVWWESTLAGTRRRRWP